MSKLRSTVPWYPACVQRTGRRVKKPRRSKSKSANAQRGARKAPAVVAVHRGVHTPAIDLKPAPQSASHGPAHFWQALARLNEGINGTPPKRIRTQSQTSALTHAATHASDDRLTFTMVSAPVIAMAIALAVMQSAKPMKRAPEIAAAPPPAAASVRAIDAANIRPPVWVAASPPAALTAPLPPAAISLSDTTPSAATRRAAPADLASPTVQSAAAAASPAPVKLLPSLPGTGLASSEPSGSIATSPAPAAIQADVPGRQIALVMPTAPAASLPGREPAPGPANIAREPADTTAPQICLAPVGGIARARSSVLPARPTGLSPAAFGAALAAAAREQTREFVIYDDTYRRIAYPMGDVARLYGVCTDVIIRAYRAVGIDLQQRVHEAGMSGGDTSIGHRRTETLRRYFARFGDALPITRIAEDYRPGDVVTYYRPQNAHSKSHIAMVTDVVAPSGRYMIAHNRGWGVQLEDGLFVDEITGHYRYTGGPAAPSPAVLTSSAPSETPRITARAGLPGVMAIGKRRPEALSSVQRDGAPASGLGH
jgi:uncharacterized protein YijF (DUF1287 family)